METLPDYLREGLLIVSIGLNPSLPSVEHGFYFANPRNRFWKALNQSGLIDEPLTPGLEAQAILFDRYHFGLTDVVKRPSSGGSSLRAGDFREGAPLLRDKLLRYQPLIAWFHGKQAYQNYLKHTGSAQHQSDWGEQSEAIGNSVVFVTPNPSPANAAFSLPVLTEWYAELGVLRARLSHPSVSG